MAESPEHQPNSSMETSHASIEKQAQGHDKSAPEGASDETKTVVKTLAPTSKTAAITSRLPQDTTGAAAHQPSSSSLISDPLLNVAAQAKRSTMIMIQPPAATTMDTAISTEPAEFVTRTSPEDILLGRGRPFQSHPGNQNMLRLVDGLRDHYSKTDRKGKHSIIESILDLIHERGGRFLEKNEVTQIWQVAPQNIRYRKVGHAFRSKARSGPCDPRDKDTVESILAKAKQASRNHHGFGDGNAAQKKRKQAQKLLEENGVVISKDKKYKSSKKRPKHHPEHRRFVAEEDPTTCEDDLANSGMPRRVTIESTAGGGGSDSLFLGKTGPNPTAMMMNKMNQTESSASAIMSMHQTSATNPFLGLPPNLPGAPSSAGPVSSSMNLPLEDDTATSSNVASMSMQELMLRQQQQHIQQQMIMLQQQQQQQQQHQRLMVMQHQQQQQQQHPMMMMMSSSNHHGMENHPMMGMVEAGGYGDPLPMNMPQDMMYGGPAGSGNLPHNVHHSHFTDASSASSAKLERLYLERRRLEHSMRQQQQVMAAQGNTTRTVAATGNYNSSSADRQEGRNLY